MSEQPNILIVEDNQQLARKYSRVLEHLAHCEIVESTPDVFYYLNYDPQVILLDIRLFGDPVYHPDEAGLRILEKIRQLPAPDGNIPVIIVTGFDDQEIKNRCTNLGIEKYFIKSQVTSDDLREAVSQAIKVRNQTKQPIAHHQDNQTTVILFLAANPIDTSRIELEREFREIDQTLFSTIYRDKFDIRRFGAIRSSDLQGYLRRYKPNIVHFSGHGDQSGSIILEGKSGSGQPVSIDALENFFRLMKNKIRCVVLNACYTEPQAQAIAKHVDCVIGMSNAIHDDAAISFATAFYESLGSGDNLQTAFELGCNQINLDGLEDRDKPKLIALNCAPETIYFV